eukprot:349642-Chlamydomonas_euryale.AAC.4
MDGTARHGMHDIGGVRDGMEYLMAWHACWHGAIAWHGQHVGMEPSHGMASMVAWSHRMAWPAWWHPSA